MTDSLAANIFNKRKIFRRLDDADIRLPLPLLRRGIPDAVMSGETPLCKSCEGANLEQQLSLIASPNKGGDASAGSEADFGACSTGMCCGAACGAFADA